jgi:signal transduction histidine kinase
MNFSKGHCPITQLPVIQKPEWTNVGFGGDYRVSFWLLGDHILFTKAFGGPTERDLNEVILLSQMIENQFLPNHRSHVRIEDWSELNRVDRRARDLYIGYILNNPRIHTLIFYGLSTPLKVAVKIALKFKHIPFNVEIAEDYAGAINKAGEIWDGQGPVKNGLKQESGLTAPAGKGPMEAERVDFDPAWEIRKEDYSLRYQFFDVNILHGLPSGKLREEYIEPSFRLMEEAVRHIQASSKSYYYILGLRGIEGLNQRARKLYITTLVKFYRQYPFEGIIFYGVNKLLKTAINLSAPFVPFKVGIAENRDEALELVKRKKRKKILLFRNDADSKSVINSDQTQKYVHDILQYLDQIEWGEEKDHTRMWTDRSHPFHTVFEALDLLRWEYNDLMRERILTEEALKSSKEEAEKASRAKSEFLANMSHELRTPLNHIIGFSELLSDQHFGPLNPTQAEYLHDVLQSSHHLLALINDILDLSKVEAGKMVLDLSPVPIQSLLDTSLIMIKEKAQKHRIRIQTDYRDLPEAVLLDERKIKQILFNLLSNAVKFTPDGGTVHLVAHKISNGHGDLPAISGSYGKTEMIQDHIKIGIHDTGIGIAPRDLEKIFKPFEQADNSASRRFQGTGLGLSLTRRLVELHGGKIWAESPGVGQGSSFHFVFPMSRLMGNCL